MMSAKYALCPVGTAATSYRLYEAIQMGIVPIYINDERGAFIPYKGSQADVSKLGFVFDFESAEEKLAAIVDAEKRDEGKEVFIKNLRRRIAEVRETHFTPVGVANQIKKWIAKPHVEGYSDLACCANPL